MLVVSNDTSYTRIDPVRGIVYKGQANTLQLNAEDVYPRDLSSSPKNWNGVTRMVLKVVSFNAETNEPIEIVATADTDDDATLIDYSKDGRLTLKLGSLTATGGGEIPAGEYYMRLTQYVGSVQTQILHESTQVARLKFVDVDVA